MTIADAINWTNSLRIALSSMISSRIPDEKISIPEISKGSAFLKERVLSVRKRNVTEIIKLMAIAIPPRRGILPEWILLALTVSYKL